SSQAELRQLRVDKDAPNGPNRGCRGRVVTLEDPSIGIADAVVCSSNAPTLHLRLPHRMAWCVRSDEHGDFELPLSLPSRLLVAAHARLPVEQASVNDGARLTIAMQAAPAFIEGEVVDILGGEIS